VSLVLQGIKLAAAQAVEWWQGAVQAVFFTLWLFIHLSFMEQIFVEYVVYYILLGFGDILVNKKGKIPNITF
jgi:hypothetical protein